MSADPPSGAAAPSSANRAGGLPDGAGGWRLGLAVYASPVMASMVMLGFASGLPLYMVFTKLSFWLRESGVDRSTIGFFYWVTFAYSFKFIWAPVVDRVAIPGLTGRVGHRRSWMMVAIAGTAVGLFVLANANPAQGLGLVAIGALLLAFSGATLDISIDAWRIESAPSDMQANMAAAYSLGYRGALIFSGLGLAMAEWASWGAAYLLMAAAMAVTGTLVLLVREPARVAKRALTDANLAVRLARMLVEPAVQVAQRLGWWLVAVAVLLAIYRLSDFTMGVMASPLYADIGYSKAAVGGIQSGPGVAATIVGLFVGGAAALRFGVMRAMIIGAVITLATNAAYAWLAATAGPDDLLRLSVAIMADNVAGGFVTTVFIAYMSGLTDPANAATQYALFAFMWSFFAKLASGFSGVMADAVGYVWFFLITATYAIPAALLVVVILVWGPASAQARGFSAEKEA